MVEMAAPTSRPLSSHVPVGGGYCDQPGQAATLGEFVHFAIAMPGSMRRYWQDLEPRGEQRMDTGVTGGFMVPHQFRGALMSVDPDRAIVRPRAPIIPAGSPPDAAITMPALDQTGDGPANVLGGVEVSWLEEGGDKPEIDFALREITLQPKEVAGFIEVTDQLLRNWNAAARTIEELLRAAVVQAEDQAFLTGNGVGKPQGILTAPATLDVNREENGAIKYVDLVGMIEKLLTRGGGEPIWIANRSILPQPMQMRNEREIDGGEQVGGDGGLIWQPDARVGAAPSLLGFPVLFSERLPLLGNRGDLLLADLYYLIKDGSGPFVASSEHSKFKSNRTVIKVFYLVDGQSWLTGPFKGEDGREVSPFIALAPEAGCSRPQGLPGPGVRRVGSSLHQPCRHRRRLRCPGRRAASGAANLIMEAKRGH